MKRKVIQYVFKSKGQESESLLAFCDDGTIWLWDFVEKEWEELDIKPVPGTIEEKI